MSTLFEYSEIPGFERFKYNDNNVAIVNELVSHKQDFLYTYSLGEFFSYYDSPKRRLYINKDYKDTGDIILISVTGKNVKKCEIIAPHCSNERLYEVMKSIPMKVTVTCLTDEYSQSMIKTYKDLQRVKEQGDYILDCKELSELDGGKWKRSRKKIHKSEKELTWRFANYDDYDLLVHFFKEWLQVCKDTMRLSRPVIGRDIQLLDFIWKNKLLDKNPFFIVLVFYEGELDAIRITEMSPFKSEWQIGVTKKSLRKHGLSSFYAGWISEDIGYKEGRLYCNTSGGYGDMYNKSGIANHKDMFKPISFHRPYTLKFKKTELTDN
jgi:hypothetical protein